MPNKSQLKCYFGCVVDGPLHRFPNWCYNIERFNQWKSILQHSTQERGNKYIYQSIKLCYRHFDKSYHLPSRLLTRNAIPTLNIANEARETIEVVEAAKIENQTSPRQVQNLSFHNNEEYLEEEYLEESDQNDNEMYTTSASKPNQFNIYPEKVIDINSEATSQNKLYLREETNIQKKFRRRKVVKSSEALRRIYYLRKCKNASLERKKLMNEISNQKKEHDIKIKILQKNLSNLYK